MKTFSLFSKGASLLAVCVLSSCFVVSCVNKDADFSTDGKTDGNGGTPTAFTFNTTQDIQLNVQYEAPKGYEVCFQVYFENPFELKDGQWIKRSSEGENGVKPYVVRQTDENGRYSGKEVIPGYLSGEVYIYTSYVGVPSLYKTTLQGNTLQANITWDTMYDLSSAPNSRATKSDFTVPSELGTLGDWDVKGRPTYLDSEGALTLERNFLNLINKTLPEGGNLSSEYRQVADFKVYDKDNKDVNVKVRFVGGTSSASSAFGYYCYKEGASAADIQKAKKYIVFPNTKTGVGIKGGECVQLHYIDEKGVDRGTSFPNGTMIGWFIRNDAFRDGNIGNGYATFCSTTSLNSDRRTHTAAFKIGDFIVLSFEDWTDSDYNDVMFNVWSNPVEAISPDIPEVKPETPDDKVIAYSVKYNGIVAFEDNWPAQKDYDLNDVVVKYNSVVNFNTKNQVLSTADTFTALWSGAAYMNSFAYQLNTDRTNVESSSAAASIDGDLALATFTVFQDMKEATGTNDKVGTKTTTVTITNKFKNPVDHEAFGTAPYNPFISVHKQAGFDRTEVHLVNYKPTDKANKALFHTEKDLSDWSKGLFYVSDAKYPFAIHLSDATTYSTTEGERVDVTYPKFASWVESNGTKDKNWYLIKK